MPEGDHPIANDIIKDILLEQSVTRTEFPHPGRLENVATKLRQIQSILQEDLRTLVSWAYYPAHESEISILWESPDYFIFRDASATIKPLITDIIDTKSWIQKMHTRMTERLMRGYPDRPVEDDDFWIVQKQPAWRDGQWSRTHLLTQLIERGVTPTQAVDYMMIEIFDYRVARWAQSRDTTTQSIWSNVKDAKDILENDTSDLPDSPPTPSTRMYHGINDVGEYTVTVDGGYLDPRRDIALYTLTGEFAWGYDGSGPRQLATAILADALGATDLSEEVIVQFLDYFNAEKGEQEEWTMRQNEVVTWAKTQTEFFE